MLTVVMVWRTISSELQESCPVRMTSSSFCVSTVLTFCLISVLPRRRQTVSPGVYFDCGRRYTIDGVRGVGGKRPSMANLDNNECRLISFQH